MQIDAGRSKTFHTGEPSIQKFPDPTVLLTVLAYFYLVCIQQTFTYCKVF